jgi:hypothetical protein
LPIQVLQERRASQQGQQQLLTSGDRPKISALDFGKVTSARVDFKPTISHIFLKCLFFAGFRRVD